MSEQVVSESLSKRSAFMIGLREAASTFPAVVSFGLITGVTTKAVGLSSLQAIVMSFFLFSGTAQLASLQLFADGASLLIIYLTVCLVNFRYVMYSAALLPYLRDSSFLSRAFFSYIMVDQSFAFGVNRFQENPDMLHKTWYYVGISLPLFLMWGTAASVGVVLGAQVPSGLSLEFSLPLVFLALAAVTIKNKATVVTAIVAGVSAALFASLPNGVGLLIAAVLGVTAGLMSEKWFKAS